MIYQGSAKKMVQILVEHCRNFGIKHVIISPGSRNAPLIIAFDNHPDFICYSIPDERSAAFYGLGMARQLNAPVAIVCTSGTAVLNFAPALTEAFYQEIPLIAITADRPPELIDQEDGQTIRQHNIFNNHIKHSCTLSVNQDADSIEIANNAIQAALNHSLEFPKGPVHINIPFTEPLYESCEVEIKNAPFATSLPSPTLNKVQKAQLIDLWNGCNKIMVLAGVLLPNTKLNTLINQLANEKNVLVLAPPTSNLFGENIFNTIDGLILSINENETEAFKPDLLITLGGPVISKNIKQFIRNNKPTYHFDIDLNPLEINTYQCLSHKWLCDAETFVNFAIAHCPEKNADFVDGWKVKDKHLTNKNACIAQLPWSDLSVFNTFFNCISSECDLHLANSTPVRYAELFKKHYLLNYFCNRGTSGIDGCTSTAAGAALVSGKATIIITGDISFVYDSNAFWNCCVPKNLKIILINNNGGNIFKVIPGPGSTNQLEKLFVTHQTAHAQKICEAFEIDYLKAENQYELEAKLPCLLASTNCTVLEVFTPSDASAQTFKNYIALLKT